MCWGPLGGWCGLEAPGPPPSPVDHNPRHADLGARPSQLSVPLVDSWLLFSPRSPCVSIPPPKNYNDFKSFFFLIQNWLKNKQ